MCVIIVLSKNQMIPFKALETACFNNWHSYGLVTKVDGKLDIKKHVPKNGEIDAKAIHKLLEDDIEYERFLHLRHNTAGATTPENCHPFDVYYDPKSGRQVVFMHNGTLYGYKSKKKNESGNEVDDDTGPSDTKNFVDRVLIPYLCSLDFGNGKADIEHKGTQELIKRFWAPNNRGLLISSDQRPFFIDDWKQVNDGDGGKFLASNDSYFDKVERGPEHGRRLLRQAEFEATLQASSGSGVVREREIERITNFNPTIGKSRRVHGFYGLSESLAKVVNDFEMYDRKNATRLGFATPEEIKELYDQEADCINVMDWVFTDYAKLYQENEELIEKNKKASNIIAGYVEERRARAG